MRSEKNRSLAALALSSRVFAFRRNETIGRDLMAKEGPLANGSGIARSFAPYVHALTAVRSCRQGFLSRGVHRNESSAMRDPIDIDHKYSSAIRREIGQSLRARLQAEPELPTNLKEKVDRLRAIDGESPSIVPGKERASASPSREDASRGQRPRFAGWWWQKK